MFSIPTIAGIKTFLGNVPREVWYALAVIAAIWWLRADAYSDGREAVLTELREAEADAKDESLKRVEAGNKAGAIRAEKEAAVIAEQIEAIEKAEAEGRNALDELF